MITSLPEIAQNPTKNQPQKICKSEANSCLQIPVLKAQFFLEISHLKHIVSQMICCGDDADLSWGIDQLIPLLSKLEDEFLFRNKPLEKGKNTPPLLSG